MASLKLKGTWKLISYLKSADILSRSSHTINVLNNKIYVFGGEHNSRVPINNKFMVYDLNESKWNTIESRSNLAEPMSRVAHSSCLINDKIYIFGGRVGIGMGEGSLNDLYEFDTKNNTWTLLDDGKSSDSPIPRSYHTMTALNDCLYIFGGCAENRLNDFYCYDLNKNQWRQLAQDNRIIPRGGASICAYSANNENYIYLVGGFAGKELNDCYVYNVRENKWSLIQNLPLGLSVFSMASVNNKPFRLVLFGGEKGPSKEGHKTAGEFSSDTYVFDGENWVKVETENDPIARAWHVGSYNDGKFYIHGGMLENSERTSDLYALEFN